MSDGYPGQKSNGPNSKGKTSVEMGIDLELATTRGYATHAGVDKARLDELEAGMMKAMGHSALSGLSDEL